MNRVSEERICEIFLKLMEPEDAVSFMLQEGSVRFLVTEEVNQEDLAALKTSLEDIKGVIQKLAPLGGKVSSLQGFLDKANAAVEKGSAFASALNLQDADGVMGTVKQFFGGKVDLSQALKAVAKIYSQASTAATTVTNAAELIGGELSDKIEGDAMSEPLAAAAEKAGLEPDLMKQAFTKAFKSARPGMLSRMTDFFKNAVAQLKGAEIPEFDSAAFAEEAAANLSLDDLINLGKVSDEIDEPPKEDLEDIAEAEPGEIETGEDAAGGEGEEEGKEEEGKEEEEGELSGEDAELSEEEAEEAEEMADDAGLGGIPFGKMELTGLLKSFPDITGKGNKATKSRRAFRLAINKAAGQSIFEESFDRSPKQAEVLVENLFQPEEDPVISRWMRLAGL